MALSDDEVREALQTAWGKAQDDKQKLSRLRDYLAGTQLKPKVPLNVDPQMHDLVRRSTTNLMRLAVDIPARMAFVEGFWQVDPINGGVDLNPPEWAIWAQSGFRAQQVTVFKTSLTYGRAYVMVDPVDGVLRLLTTMDTVAFFRDPVNDRVPMFAVTTRTYPTGKRELVFMDDKRIITVPTDNTMGNVFSPEWLDSPDVLVQEHQLGQCPVVSFPCHLDDEGNAMGVVEPLIPAQDRVNQSAFDLLVTQGYGSFAVRWASGMSGEPVIDQKTGEPIKDANGFIISKPIELSQARMLVAEAPDAKFGTLAGTPVDGFVTALDNAIRTFAVMANIPPHSLLGSMNNLSGETIEAAMGQTKRFTHMLKVSWGESVTQLMGLVRRCYGFPESQDAQYQVRWADMNDQSMAQIVDALGKASASLGVPGRGLWSRIPGTTDADIIKWDNMAQDEKLAENLDGTGTVVSAGRERITLDLFGGEHEPGTSGADSP